MTAPWNRWFHCIGGTYGSWLPGDPRGFRTRRHREHVEGDYRNPPPAGIYERQHCCAADRMRSAPVILRPDERRIVCLELARTLLVYGVELIDLSVGGQHYHALCRFPLELPPGPGGSPRPTPQNLLTDGRDPVGRHILGRAKRAASVAMFRLGRKDEDRPLWGKRGKLLPIRDRRHQLSVVDYIRNHAAEGAAVWSQIRPR